MPSWFNQRYPHGKPTNGKRSAFEDKVYNAMVAKGVTVEYETKTLEYISDYIPDFYVATLSGKHFYLETKGYFTPEDRAKMLKVIKNNPGIDIRMVFQANNKLNPKSDTRYTDWCNKHGIRCAIGAVPSEWLTE